ncbi:MAG: 2-dehydropantoate 2-reductase, partial [Gammaproteobacteria bacterium]|nr:2-dehydropantoate 2-reductase [Gammaproteobacteria bacterium]
MKIAIYGAGAIGGWLGARLAEAGEEVTLVARGAHLAAMREGGLTLIERGESRIVPVRATGDTREAGAQDYVVLAVKAHAVAPALADIAPLLGPRTAVVTAQNGIPWWYFWQHPGPLANRHLDTVDPGGVIWRALGPERAIGCVVYPSCEIVEPGVIRHLDGERFMLGDIGDGSL